MPCIEISFDFFFQFLWKIAESAIFSYNTGKPPKSAVQKIVHEHKRGCFGSIQKIAVPQPNGCGTAVLKVPMYLNRYVSRSGEPFSHDDAVNKMLHHLPGQMLYMDITENTLPLLVLRVRSGF